MVTTLKLINLLWIFILMIPVIMAQEEKGEERQKMFEFNASYIGDFAGNATGGTDQGFGYLGYAAMSVTFNSQAAGWWKGGCLTVGGATTHGVSPSEWWLGDFQVADNIEAGNHIFLQELYFQQTLGRVCIQAGLHDFNSSYAFSETAGLFLNSSFGINSILSSSFDVPIFPVTSWGLNLKWHTTDWLHIQVGAYDSPFGFDQNPHNIRWQFCSDKGAIIAGETEFITNIHGKLSGAVKTGAAYQTALQTWELHLCAEQTLWQRDKHHAAAFLLAAWSPKAQMENWLHLAGGLRIRGIFSKQGKDCLGMGVSTSLFDNDFVHETALELTYQYTVSDQFYLQPDIQYIFNPAGTQTVMRNPLFMALRTGIIF